MKEIRVIASLLIPSNPVTQQKLVFSGTHWLTNILTFLMKGSTCPYKDSSTKHVFNLELQAPDKNSFNPRILRTHILPQLLPSDAFKKGRKIILTCRNPKDTAVSLYYFLKKEKYTGYGLNISWNCFIDHWIKESCK